MPVGTRGWALLGDRIVDVLRQSVPWRAVNQPSASSVDHERSGPADLMLDVVLFAPVGAMCCFPELAGEVFADPAHAFTHASDEGRRVIGATERRVQHRLRQRSEQVHRALDGLGLSWSIPSWMPSVPGLSTRGLTEAEPAPPMVAPADESPPPRTDPSASSDADPAGERVGHISLAVGAAAGPSVAEATLGITDYASLSASQVMPRLEGLTPDELETLRQFELQNRGRKTILNKIAQLQQPAPSDV